MSQKFLVEEVSQRDELDAIAWAILDYSDESRHLFFPILYGRKAAFHEVSERLWKEHNGDPASHWIFVRDSSSPSLSVIGACQWRFYETNPFSDGAPDLEATWWPKGGGRDFTTKFVKKVMLPRTRWMSRPHSGMSWIFVRPDHRRSGIGKALMSWGMEKTDELGLESYIEATAVGKLLYESCGYARVIKVDFDVKDDQNQDEVWKSLETRYKDFDYNCMWRPAHGQWTDGDPQATWSERLAGENALSNYSNW